MNILPFEMQVAAIAALTEGCSIRATERLTGIHRDTIMRLGVRVGQGCTKLHDALMCDLQPNFIQIDELWSYIGRKQRKGTPDDTADLGDCYTFTALDNTSKALISYHVGKRDGDNCRAFIWDLRERVINAPQISSDAFGPYEQAIRDAFGDQVHYGQIVKKYAGEPAKDAARRYSPGYVVGVTRRKVAGFPVKFLTSTSNVERSNLTFRMQQRRFTRLTNGFSKKLENHTAAVGLFVGHYNFCRVHEALRITPAMQLGITEHIWTIAELIEAALSGDISEPEGRRVGPFRVIDGGVS